MAVRVLLVDDNDVLLGLVAEVLRDEGHKVSTAATGTLALVQCGTWGPDLIVLDLLMPEAAGAPG